MSDEAILARAKSDHRTVITFDKDFGELAIRFKLSDDCGIVLFRLTHGTRREFTDRVVATLLGRDDWHGAFWTITDDRIRRRPLSGL